MPKSGQPWDPRFLAEHPLFRAWEPFAKPFRTENWPNPELYTQVCATFSEKRWDARPEASLSPLRFRAMQKKSRRDKRQSVELEGLYDGSIALRGEIPCLEQSYHDLLNAIVFCAFPRSKRALHARQFEAQKRWLEEAGVLDRARDTHRLPGARSREQDALTILDEGGTVLVLTETAHAIWRSAKTRLTLDAFSPGQVLPLLFGHALLEHLVEGRTALRSSGVMLVVPDARRALAETESDAVALFAIADRHLARRISDPDEFLLPGADAIFELAADQIFIGPPKPAWHLPNPLSPALPPGASHKTLLS